MCQCLVIYRCLDKGVGGGRLKSPMLQRLPRQRPPSPPGEGEGGHKGVRGRWAPLPPEGKSRKGPGASAADSNPLLASCPALCLAGGPGGAVSVRGVRPQPTDLVHDLPSVAVLQHGLMYPAADLQVSLVCVRGECVWGGGEGEVRIGQAEGEGGHKGL